MSLYGHTKINIESLKRWANALSIDNITEADYGGEPIIFNEITKKILNIQLQGFVALINKLKPGDDWRTCQYIISPIFYSAFIRLNNNSIRIGDYYECFVVPSDMNTHKKIIKGFDYNSIGAIDIYDGEKVIATIGQKSDLMWTTFYDYFINENEDGSIDHTYVNHEHVLSIQLFDVENKTFEELVLLTNEILLRVSMEYGMNFKIYSVDHVFKQIGDDSIHKMQYKPTGYEQVPMLYLSNAINTQDERLAYLSYYQVIEYFFVRVQNYYFLNELLRINAQNVNHNELRKVLASYKKISSERESLKLVLTKSVDISNFKSWIVSDQKYQDTYCTSNVLKIDISKNDEKIISDLTKRVYSYRCSIAHAKGDVEEYVAIPSLSNKKIADELPLLKYLSFVVIESCSET